MCSMQVIGACLTYEPHLTVPGSPAGAFCSVFAVYRPDKHCSQGRLLVSVRYDDLLAMLSRNCT